MRDPYLYPDVDVLINKDNIKDQDLLDKLEENVVPLKMIALRKEGLTIQSVFDICKIHKVQSLIGQENLELLPYIKVSQF